MTTTRTVLTFSALLALTAGGCAGTPAANPAPRAAPAWVAPSPSADTADPSPTEAAPVDTAPTKDGAPTEAAQVPGTSRTGVPPPVIAHGPRTTDRVALTFDADLTDAMAANLRSGRVRSYANLAIIDLLERRQIPATFFVTGQWAEQYPALMRRLAGNPRFEIANHSYEHAAFTGECYGLPRLPADAMTDDVAKTFSVLAPYGGRQTRYFRFPGLCHDTAAMAALSPLGVTVVDGDVVSGDPFATSAKPVVRAVLSQVRPGSIVIMHVTEANARYTDEALPQILDGLDKRGLRPIALAELMAGG